MNSVDIIDNYLGIKRSTIHIQYDSKFSDASANLKEQKEIVFF